MRPARDPHVKWIAIGLALAALGLAVRWYLRRVDSLGRARSFPYASVGLLAVLSVVAVVPTYLREKEEGRLDRAASAIVGQRVSVHCQTFGESFTDAGAELGFVRWGPNGVPEHRTLIKRDACHQLKDYLSSDKLNPTEDEVVAVHVLTHESMHMSGIKPEARAECAAMQRDTRMAELLGASPPAARILARRYWTEVYPRMPEDYQTSECGPGGQLDEGLPDPPWSTTG